jgi:hypothetical protein
VLTIVSTIILVIFTQFLCNVLVIRNQDDHRVRKNSFPESTKRHTNSYPKITLYQQTLFRKLTITTKIYIQGKHFCDPKVSFRELLYQQKNIFQIDSEESLKFERKIKFHSLEGNNVF